MVKKKTFLEGLGVTERLLNDIIFMCETRMKPTYFTRQLSCKLDFKSLILFQLNFIKKTLQLELDSFLDISNGGDRRISKQGYSEARQKISPTAFVKMADAIITWYYQDDDFKKFRGYRLSAIDASILELSNSERLRNAFGYAEGGTSFRLARAKAAGIYDLENGMMLVSAIDKYTTGERQIAIQMIDKLVELGLKNDLILFDRGYPSKAFFSYLDKTGINYLVRISSQRIKQIHEAKEPDQVIHLETTAGETLKIRVIRFALDSGEEEVLVTNLFDDTLGLSDFKELYFKRWGIEVKFAELKSRLQLENFTGDTVISVEQDFYASMYLSNMATLAKNEANEQIEADPESKKRKYEYKVNMNILIGKLKDNLIEMLLESNPEKRKTLYRQIMSEISGNIVPVRPGRRNKRRKGLRAIKHPLNGKRSL